MHGDTYGAGPTGGLDSGVGLMDQQTQRLGTQHHQHTYTHTQSEALYIQTRLFYKRRIVSKIGRVFV